MVVDIGYASAGLRTEQPLLKLNGVAARIPRQYSVLPSTPSADANPAGILQEACYTSDCIQENKT